MCRSFSERANPRAERAIKRLEGQREAGLAREGRLPAARA